MKTMNEANAKTVKPTVAGSAMNYQPAPTPGMGSGATVTKSKVSKGLYAVTFSVFYETVVGESLAVVGSIAELGSWKEYDCHLQWTTGHLWKSVEPLYVTSSCFQYKYVLLENDEMVKWEEGCNRIADLDALPEMPKVSTTPSMMIKLQDEKTDAKVQSAKHVAMADEWEQYKVRFTLFDPLYLQGDEMWMKPNPLSQLEAMRMQRANKPELWLGAKYGQPLDVWECFIDLKNMNGDSDGQYQAGCNMGFGYSYVKSRRGQSQIHKECGGQILERQPERSIYLRDPKAYQGEISDVQQSATCHWKIQDNVNVINGVVEKADGTFLEGFFFNQLVEGGAFHSLVLGPYPLYEVDVDQIVEQGKVNAVLSLQSDVEMRQRGLDENQLKKWYQTKGVLDYIRYPVEDDNQDRYAELLFEACKALDHLVSNKRTVYIHCTSGQSRCTTLATLYLCLFLKSKNWNKPHEIEKALKICHKGGSPNMQAVNLALAKYKQF